MRLTSELERFFSTAAPVRPGDRVVVAFSGGPDSTALLWALERCAGRLSLSLVAAHLDHAMDPGSEERARKARRLARRIGVPWVAERRPVERLRLPGEGDEEAGRRLRYGFLEEVRRRTGARWIATAHHRDDQAETVLLRLRYGSGLRGLAGIRPVWGRVVRPLLGLSREELRAAVEASGLTPVDDPTNRQPVAARNRLRRDLLPRLAAAEPGLVRRLAALAEAARRADRAIEARLESCLAPEPWGCGVAVARQRVAALPPELLPRALALLHRRAGAPLPPGQAARRELRRQIGRGGRVGCDCGGGWRWRVEAERLVLDRAEPPAVPFSYTLVVPGELAIPEAGLRFRLTPGPVADWMFRHHPARAGLALPLKAGGCVTVRSRRPGDRLVPLGHSRPRRLKEVLIDHRIPGRQRDSLPLLAVEGEIAWVPGATIGEGFRLPHGGTVWIAEVAAAGGGCWNPRGPIRVKESAAAGRALEPTD